MKKINLIILPILIIPGWLALSGCDVSSVFSSTTDGEYHNPSGRLQASTACYDSNDCIKLCDSMLKNLSDQKDCYALSQSEAQRLRDTYNLLALGSERKLEEVEIEEIDNFLKFGSILWLDAISGFEAGRKDKEDCVDIPVEDLEKSCKTDNYYRQKGYDVEGARSTLKWMSESPWLTEYLERHDEDLLILKNLFYCALKADEDDFCFENSEVTAGKLYEPIFKLETETQKQTFEDAVVHVLALLSNQNAMSDSIDLTDLLNGLTENEIEDRKTVFFILNHDISTNSEFLNFIHEEIIVNRLCSIDKHGQQLLDTLILSWFFEEECILKIYCRAGTNEDANDNRAKIPELINDNDVEYYIKSPLGLGITIDTHKWPVNACQLITN